MRGRPGFADLKYALVCRLSNNNLRRGVGKKSRERRFLALGVAISSPDLEP
jgi:hypothetical protein